VITLLDKRFHEIQGHSLSIGRASQAHVSIIIEHPLVSIIIEHPLVKGAQ
jgi:hypothetical protein